MRIERRKQLYYILRKQHIKKVREDERMDKYLDELLNYYEIPRVKMRRKVFI